jgi:hypothetical protein
MVAVSLSGKLICEFVKVGKMISLDVIDWLR